MLQRTKAAAGLSLPDRIEFQIVAIRMVKSHKGQVEPSLVTQSVNSLFNLDFKSRMSPAVLVGTGEKINKPYHHIPPLHGSLFCETIFAAGGIATFPTKNPLHSRVYL